MNERKWLFKSLVGSHNYNLNTETSDKDYKLYVVPTFEDIYHNKQVSKSVTSDTEDVCTHDIRQFTNMLYKSNVNFIETLFSRELILNPELSMFEYRFMKDMIKNREAYARMNLPYLWDACMGMYHQNAGKMKYINVVDTEILHLYNTKKAMTAFRIVDFLIRYAKNIVNSSCEEPFKNAITYNEQERDFMLDIKNGKHSLSTIEIMLDTILKEAELYKDFYKSQEVNERLKTELESEIKRIVYKNI